MLCSQCFSSAISAVSVTRSTSRCPACLQEVETFVADPTPSKSVKPRQRRRRVSSAALGAEKRIFPTRESSHVLRIDNIAWVSALSIRTDCRNLNDPQDITPEVVHEFLPSGVLPKNHPQPIHILLDRFDGRTKDYMVSSIYQYWPRGLPDCSERAHNGSMPK